MRARAADVLFCTLLAAFVALGLTGLDAVPAIHVDEGWQAAPGWELFTTGRFATDLFAGFAGMEKHYYGFMPLFPILLGASLKVFGFGLFQARLVPLALASAVLALTYVLGRRVLSAWHGLVAATALALWPLSIPAAHLTTGIPLVDLARVARYDIAVPVFGLLALLVVAQSCMDGTTPSARRSALAGFLAGLATLCHVYGAAWLLGALVPFGRRGLARRAAAALGGFLLALAPWLAFVATGLPDFLAQNRNYAPRFALTSPAFYAGNLARELDRYRGIGAAARAGTLAPWIFTAALVAGAVLLSRRRAPAARLVLAPAAVLAASFALLLEQKNRMYLASLWPLLALVAAAGLVPLLTARARAVRVAGTLLLAAACLEGGVRARGLVRRTRAVTSYPALAARLRDVVPAGARVLGLPDHWLALAPHAGVYRAINVPINLALPHFTERPIPFADTVERFAPDVVLLDEPLLRFLDETRAASHPYAAVAGQVRDWLTAHAGARTELEDPTYGRVAVYRVSR